MVLAEVVELVVPDVLVLVVLAVLPEVVVLLVEAETKRIESSR